MFPKSPSKLPPLGEAIKSLKLNKKKEILLTGIRDVDLKILEELSDQELFSFCLVNKEANKLCSNEVFWRNRFIKRFGNFSQMKPENRSYKNFYLSLIKELSKEIDMEDLKKKERDIYNIVFGLNQIKEKVKKYQVHDNGARPFNVYIDKMFVLIYKEIEVEKYSKSPNFVFLNPKKIFIGISHQNAITEFGGGYGEEYDGNSIVINTDDNNYVYIGSEIYSFTAKSEIIEYVSNVGNNDVPYPYAIDKEKNIYLMLEKIILTKGIKLEDPYDHYYNGDISKISGFKIYFRSEEGEDDEEYNLSYISDIESRVDEEKGVKRYFKVGNQKRYFTDEQIIDIMKRYEAEMGFEPMKTFLLHDRIY